MGSIAFMDKQNVYQVCIAAAICIPILGMKQPVTKVTKLADHKMQQK